MQKVRALIVSLDWRRVATIALGGYVIAMLVMSYWGGIATGISFPEPRHNWRLQTFLTDGYYLPGLSGVGLDQVRGKIFVYGPAYSAIAHFVNFVFGNETWFGVSGTAEAYYVRHIVLATIGLVAVAAVAWTVRLSTKSWRFGLLGAAILLSIAQWTGETMFNSKDVTVATGFTLITAGFVAIATQRDRSDRIHFRFGIASLTLGTFLAMGVRLGMWPAILIDLLVLCVTLFWFGDRKELQAIRPLTKIGLVIGAVILAYGLLALLYPAVFLHPIEVLVGSFSSSSAFPWQGHVLTNGSQLSMPPPLSYLPLWFGAQLPLYLIFLVAAGVGHAGWRVIEKISKRSTVNSDTDRELTGLLFIGVQLTVYPVAALVLHATIYGGFRQLTMVLPAAAMISAIALFALWKRLETRRPAFIKVAAGLVTLSLLDMGISQALLFPHNTNYFNQVAVAGGINGRWEVDKRLLSFREAAAIIPSEFRDRCGSYAPENGEFIPCSENKFVSPFWNESAGTDTVASLADDEYISFSNTKDAGDCRTYLSVTRPLYWSTLEVRRIYACRLIGTK
jgi:hypothetical protein